MQYAGNCGSGSNHADYIVGVMFVTNISCTPCDVLTVLKQLLSLRHTRCQIAVHAGTWCIEPSSPL